MKVRNLMIFGLIYLGTFSALGSAQTVPTKVPSEKPHKTKSKWANVSTFDCRPQEGLMTSWTGQPGRPDHEDTATIKGGSLMMCRATSATPEPPAACYVQFQNQGAYTIPSHYAMNAPPKDDVIILSCNGKAPTCCQLQVQGLVKKAQESATDKIITKPIKDGESTSCMGTKMIDGKQCTLKGAETDGKELNCHYACPD